MRILGIIPARMDSSRLPGKPMKKIHNIPMIGHCFKRSIQSKKLDKVYVATPDKEIFEYIQSINGEAVMTSHKHKMCNDRVFEAVDKVEKILKKKYDIIVNIQGDLPMIFPNMIDTLIEPILENKNISNTTMAELIQNDKEFKDPNRVKVIFDLDKNAILLTREAIPSDFKHLSTFKKYKHVAIRAYRRNFFEKLKRLKITPIEKIEAIDDLRLLENGIKIKVVLTKNITETVDNVKDLKKVITMMKKDKLRIKYS